MKRKFNNVICSLFVLVCILITGCGNSVSSEQTVAEPEINSLDNAKKAYSLLSNSADAVEIIGAGIAGAWGYAIENSNDYKGTYYGLSRVCGLSTDEVREAFTQYSNNRLGGLDPNEYESIFVGDFQESIPALIQYGYAPYLDQIDDNLAEAKSLIQTINSDESYYSDLVDYYTAISNYLEFCKSPTGSYQSLSATRNDYSSAINSAKSKLSFYLE